MDSAHPKQTFYEQINQLHRAVKLTVLKIGHFTQNISLKPGYFIRTIIDIFNSNCVKTDRFSA